jgi:hypothetical protein
MELVGGVGALSALRRYDVPPAHSWLLWAAWRSVSQRPCTFSALVSGLRPSMVVAQSDRSDLPEAAADVQREFGASRVSAGAVARAIRTVAYQTVGRLNRRASRPV